MPQSDDVSLSRIVSLLDLMKPFNASFWMEIVRVSVNPPKGSDALSNATREKYFTAFTTFKKTVTELGLPCSGATVDKILKMLTKTGSTRDQVFELIEELRPRLIDEMKGREFFVLTTQEAQHYHKPRAKWESIVERFPGAGNDVEEAWKCLACSRYTASVFHSLQIVEVGLIELGTFIGVNDPISGWSAVAQRLKKMIGTKYQDLNDFEKENRSFLEQVQGTVEALKNAWRNKVSHAHGKLTLMSGEEFHPDVTEEILLANTSVYEAACRRSAEQIIMKPYLLCICLLFTGCHKAQSVPSPPKQIEFVIEGNESHLVYNCNKFQPQIRTVKDIISLRRRTLETYRELFKEEQRNLALITSLRSALDTRDNLRVEELVVNYECGKLLLVKQ